MIEHRQRPHRDYEMNVHREIKPENGRQSSAPFAPASNTYNRQIGSPFQTKHYYTRIRRNEVGQFNPYYPNPQGLGMISDNKALVFTDVISFQERLDTGTDSAYAENQILRVFDTLMSGLQLIW
ncbi:hypothetical protein CONLIGDRAFT_224440 [Coniochaeta ligniaria NRRL 30616]|uniref:Uncharacterized protein n=1 Tax=Coniochaeta ligniaria NRRL 30616 TaxID=1408157 RepID=A0A1J7I4S5_9PEZI|nr:hypothetical protein CONLIGDRAFT_224440 [Coniochaeta ligniaria NRRL 30616]